MDSIRMMDALPSTFMVKADLGCSAHRAAMAFLHSLPSTSGLTVLACFTFLLAVALRYVLFFDPNRRMNLPPGPRPWPLLGNILVFVRADTIHAKLQELAKTHGPIFTVWIGSSPTVVFSGVKITRDALVKKAAIFASRPEKYSWRFFSAGYRTLLTTSDTAHWNLLRRLYTHRMLSPEAVAQYEEVRMSEIANSVAAFRKAEAASQDGEGFDPEPILRLQMSNIITRMNFGDAFDAEGQEVPMGPGGSLIRRSVYIEDLCRRYRLITMGSVAHLGDYMPSLRHLPASKAVYSSYQSLEDEVKAWFTPIVQARRRELATQAPNPSSRTNFIDVLLSAEGEEKLTDLDVIWILVELVMGATDTTAGTIHWAIAHCLAYPDAQRKLFEEIVSVVGHDRAVVEADLPRLVYLQAFVKETLRIRSPVALGAPHATTQACKLAGYDIPAKTAILIHTLALANDETIWDSPTDFRPERFLELTDAQKQAFLPFGLGKRNCPGMHMGLIQDQITLAALVQTFEWIPAQPVDLTEKLHFIVVPKKNLCATIRERKT